LSWLNRFQTARRKLALLKAPVAHQLTVVLTRRRERDEAADKVTYSGYDINWPDGRSVTIGLQRFCQQGTRLLLGRARNLEKAMVRVTLYPISCLEAELTRPASGIRCKRFYSLSDGDDIRFHFFTGTPTEVLFNRRDDDPAVLNWLHADRIRDKEPFWFDLGSEILEQTAVGQTATQLAGTTN
jgi:hypothetical protein